MTEENRESSDGLQEFLHDKAPSGADGAATGRDTAGRFVRGNTAATVTGARSVRFWAEAEAAIQEAVTAVLAARGEDITTAPRTLVSMARAFVQAELVRDSAFARIVETGGPLSGRDRKRGAFDVWLAAAEKAQRHAQLIGLDRAVKPAPALADYLTQRAAAGSDAA